MKRCASILWLSTLLLLSGCGGGRTPGPTSSSTSGPTSNPPQPGVSGLSDWQFSTTSTVGMPPLSIAGTITVSGNSVSGAVHVSGSNCFDRLTTIGLAGTLAGGNLSLTSASVAGQVATFAGNLTDPGPYFPEQFSGTYAISGGCAGGDQGNVSGVKVGSMGGYWAGDLTSGTGDINRLTVTLAQGSATPEGIFGLTGTAFFEVGTCFTSAKILSGTFPAGSYVIGSSVSLEIQTDNGVVVFLGADNGDGVIRGNYTLAGSTCEPAGTGYLSPWEY
jgi:hypothetical protein